MNDDSREPPYSVARGHRTIAARWLLTNAEWHTSTMSCDHVVSHETGVRDLDAAGKTIDRSFRLIQHGWRDFDGACDLIERGLLKGWNTERISDVMDRVRRLRRPKPKFL